MNIPYEMLLFIAIALLIVGAILFWFVNIPIGPTTLGTIVLILGAICLIIWVILVIIAAVKSA